jgi:hypothetical protein
VAAGRSALLPGRCAGHDRRAGPVRQFPTICRLHPGLAGQLPPRGRARDQRRHQVLHGRSAGRQYEFCTDTPTVGAGFDLYDVTDPTHPKVLVQGAGDRGGEGKLTGSLATARQYHSTFLWKASGKVYLVASDDDELHDVDIFDVTGPRSPRPVAEYDFVEEFPQLLEDLTPYGNLNLNHDMIVNEIGGRQVLLDSYRRSAGKVQKVDDYAIPESLNAAYAFGYGDLSIHEFATDPERNLAYSSYYAGGLRVVSFGATGITEVGHYIAERGNNFWGVEQFTPASELAGNLKGTRLVAASDRDYGLFIFRYTGS